MCTFCTCLNVRSYSLMYPQHGIKHVLTAINNITALVAYIDSCLKCFIPFSGRILTNMAKCWDISISSKVYLSEIDLQCCT